MTLFRITTRKHTRVSGVKSTAKSEESVEGVLIESSYNGLEGIFKAVILKLILLNRWDSRSLRHTDLELFALGRANPCPLNRQISLSACLLVLAVLQMQRFSLSFRIFFVYSKKPNKPNPFHGSGNARIF